VLEWVSGSRSYLHSAVTGPTPLSTVVRQQIAPMRFSLIDLLIAIACIASGCLAVAGVSYLLGYGHLSEARLQLFGAPVSVIFFFIITPPIYRHFHLLPLFLPVCPHCRRRPGGYRILQSVGPRTLVACGHCGQTIELWWRQPAAAYVSKTMPSLLLGWPHSVGRWRSISGGGSV